MFKKTYQVTVTTGANKVRMAYASNDFKKAFHSYELFCAIMSVNHKDEPCIVVLYKKCKDGRYDMYRATRYIDGREIMSI